MKVKILESSGWYKHFVDSEFEFVQYVVDDYLGIHIEDTGWIYRHHCVITELPESFCVKRCDDGIKWGKYIQWLNKTYESEFDGNHWEYYGCIHENEFNCSDGPIGTEIHIDDMIKHIDYMERHIKGGEQFSKESQLIAKMNKIIKEDLTIVDGVKLEVGQSYYVRYKHGVQLEWMLCRITRITDHGHAWSDTKGGVITNGSYDVKTIEEFENKSKMDTQKLSRQGLKEIHSVACSHWKYVLEGYGSRNPLEDYIELYQEEVNKIFNACTKEQLPIVSKYLKQDDGSVDVKDCEITPNYFIGVRLIGKYEYKSFYLSNEFNWEIKTDEYDQLCLIPTKKK